MPNIKNIIVTLKTGNALKAGTDDHLYVGVVGRGSGGEFNLSTPMPGDDYNRNELRIHYLGPEPADPRDPNAMPTDAVRPDKSVYDPTFGETSGINDPERRAIDIEDVEYVYIRKVGPRKSGYDDPWQLEAIQVVLMTVSTEHDPTGRPWTQYYALGPAPVGAPAIGHDDVVGWEASGSPARDIWLGTACGQQVWLKKIDVRYGGTK
ncbi:MAG: hypothetical protein QNJ09_16890 [Paracoccaceae bacterium]|nr:hypothetical protein [Paracoccaceae bacterium]